MEPTKHDHGKNRWDLLPIREVEQGVEVLTAGSIKYSDDNWKAVVAEKPGRYWAALFRHIAARLKGREAGPGNWPAAPGSCALLPMVPHVER